MDANGLDGTSSAGDMSVYNKTPRITISDPMQESAVFNMPLDSPGFMSSDSPVFAVNHDDELPTPADVDGDLSSGSSPTTRAPPLPPDEKEGPNGTRRPDGAAWQPRMLNKSRGSSETRAEKPVVEM